MTAEGDLETIGDSSAPARGPDESIVPGVSVGRYVILSRLGAGGMGVVYAAYDPELDRKIALKLLRSQGGGSRSDNDGRTRLLREAQALGRLSHPNVVAVHDVGTVGESVWIAMEFVQGQTLAQWIRERAPPWRQALAVMVSAGRGLAAAHAAGLLHRDFKPDNVMIGGDRVRVMDFGLVRAHAGDVEIVEPATARVRSPALGIEMTQAGALMGTPAYMSPEQLRGEPTDARSDEFSFCVTLWQLLFGERPFAGDSMVELAAAVLLGTVREPPSGHRVPTWLRRVCERGLSTAPDGRFPSLEALLNALERGQTRARRRKLVGAVGVLAIAVAGALAYPRYQQARRVAACEVEGASIDAVWNDDARARVRDGLLATSLSYAETTARNVMPWLDAQAQHWRASRTEACLNAQVRATWNDDQVDRAVWCLEDRRLELAALVAELARADDQVAREAVHAATRLGEISPCLDPSVLASRPRPPEAGARESIAEVRVALADARASFVAGKYDVGLAQAEAARAQADKLGWPPLVAAARALEAMSLNRMGSFAQAEAASIDAYMAAAQSGSWDVAASAAEQLISVVGHHLARHAEGRVWARHSQMAAAIAGDPSGLRAAARVANLASVELSAGAYAEAKPLLEQSLAIRERALGPDHPLVAAALSNLANVHHRIGALTEAKALLERAVAITEHAVGPDHPDFAASLNNLALVHYSAGETERAIELQTRALAVEETVLGSDHPAVATSLSNLAAMYSVLRRYEQAAGLLERALVIKQRALGAEHPEVAKSMANLASARYETGMRAAGIELHERALAIREKTLGPWHIDVADSLVNLAGIRRDTGRYVEAEALETRALAIREKSLGPEHLDVAQSLVALANVRLTLARPAEALAVAERAVAIHRAHDGVPEPELTARFALARALVAAGGDRDRAIEQARAARDGYRAAAAQQELTAVEAWLATAVGDP